MGCLKVNIRDYFTLRTSQKFETPCLDSTHQTPIHSAKHSESYTYDSIIEEKTITKNNLQLLICIQNILKMLFLFCDFRTKTPTFTLTTYTYDSLQDDFTTKNRKNDTSIRSKNAPSNNSPTTITNNYLKTTATKGSYNQNTSVSQYDYNNDALGRRTSMGKSGTAFDINGTPSPDTIAYLYNDRSEVTSASSANDTTYDFGYNFDQIGNREVYTTNESGSPVQSLYTTNNLNQYTSITNPTNSPIYNDDGCMLTNGDWTYTWDGDNRLSSAEKLNQRLEFTYDYRGRRLEKKVYSGSVGAWILDKHLKFVYDEYVQIEELDALNNNNVLKKRIWNSGKVICDIHGTTSYYAVGDANRNITGYVDSSGTIQAHYEYSPFGKITKSTGSIADNFDYRFSSEVFDQETELSYYNYRYYSAELGRWLSRDPIEEHGGLNLYAMVWNNPVDRKDKLGLTSSEEPEPIHLPPPGGKEKPGDPPGGNCGGGAWGDPTCWKSPTDIKRDCDECGKGAVSLTESPCDCTEREVHLIITEYRFLPLKGQKKKDPTKGFHMVGRTIPGKKKSEKPPVSFTPGVTWETVYGERGPIYENILDPKVHFDLWIEGQQDAFDEASNGNWSLTIVTLEKGCYCCNP